MSQLIGRLAVALAIGLLIGLERGWRRRETTDGGRAAGLRTLGLVGLLGGLLALIAGDTSYLLLPAGLLAVTAVLGTFHYLEARRTGDASATGVVAGLMAFVLGAYAISGPLNVVIGAAVVTTAILAFKDPLHAWVRGLSWIELRALLILLIMTALVLPVLPDRALDPWGALNPRRIWLLAVMVAGTSFVGYVAVRTLGARGGLLFSALAGGLASSTATTLSFARLAAETPDLSGRLAGGTLIAGAVMSVRVLVMAATLDQSLALGLAGPLAAYGGVSMLAGALLLWRGKTRPDPAGSFTLANPVEVRAALKWAALIAAIMLLSKILATTLGSAGLYAVAAVSGLVDVDALTLSVAGTTASGELAHDTARLAVLLGVAANTAVKTAIAGMAGSLRHALPVGAVNGAALVAGGAAFWMLP